MSKRSAAGAHARSRTWPTAPLRAQRARYPYVRSVSSVILNTPGLQPLRARKPL
jgi:hypothetical protein